MSNVIVDTGPLVAFLVATDAHHAGNSLRLYLAESASKIETDAYN